MQSNIYELRKGMRWSLKRVSELAGIPVNTVWRMERGYGVTLRNAFRMAKLFGVTIYDLWNFVPVRSVVPQPNRGPSSVRKLRLEHRWRLRDLAEISRVSKSTLFHVEAGHTPTLENAVKIAAALGVSVYEIWEPPGAARKRAASK